ncbi:hypothetical protein CGC20_18975 [Leishmania donovani]|uniref:Uncharacterized protein n=1 Tax=Leishmania donovani TaxID=5661 RepID=A0A504XQB1_LEIDO|nr:hypothetical protein CGC20_18975 [Leishmania donovani]
MTTTRYMCEQCDKATATSMALREVPCGASPALDDVRWDSPHRPDGDPASYRPAPWRWPETRASYLTKWSRPLRAHLQGRLQPAQFGLRPYSSATDPLHMLVHKVVQLHCARECDSVDRGARITALRKPDAGPCHTRRITPFSDDHHVCAALHWELGNTEDGPLYTRSRTRVCPMASSFIIIVVAPLRVWLSKTPGLRHASFANDLALLTPSAVKTAMRATPRPAP